MHRMFLAYKCFAVSKDTIDASKNKNIVILWISFAYLKLGGITQEVC
jgi:hypothetical protein